MAGNDLQEQLDQLAEGATLKLEPAGREFQGPLVIRRPVTLEGQGATLWAPRGPVLTVETDGVELKGLNVEVTSNEPGLDGEDACALVVAPGLNVALDGVTIRGNVLGLDSEEGDWRYPRAIPLGSLKAGQAHTFKVRLEVPVPCRLRSRIDGLTVTPEAVAAGPAEVTLRVDPLSAGTLLRGELWLQTALLTRRILVSGNFRDSGGAGTGQVVAETAARVAQPAALLPEPSTPATIRLPAGAAEPLTVPVLVADATLPPLGPDTEPLASATSVPTSPPVLTGPSSVPLHAAPPMLVVSKLGEGGFQTLGDAIRSAPNGTRIHVRPGLYKESLVLDRRLEIVGDGPRSEIVLEAVDGCCLRMETDYATVRGMTLRGTQGGGAQPRAAVSVPRGQLVLEDCVVTAEAGPCVSVHGATAAPLIRWCKIHEGKSAGVLLYDKAQGVLEDCDVHGNALAGVEIRQGANPVLRRCHVHDGAGVGVFVHDMGKGVLENCDVTGNALAGVEISQGGNPTLRHCKLHHGSYPGVRVLDNGRGLVEDCDVFENALAGVEISRGGKPTLRKCRIHDGRQAGLLFTEKGQGLVEDCVVSGNALAGVEARGGSNPTLRRCRVHGGKEVGVAVHASQPTLDDCEVVENSEAGVLVRQGGKPTLRNCRIRQGKGPGVLVCDQGEGLLDGCEISANGWAEVAVLDGGNVTLRKCRIHEGRSAGVVVGKGGKAAAEECVLRGNAVAGVVLMQGGHADLRRCEIKGNAGVGVWAFARGEGRLEKCDLRDNAAGAHQIEADCSVAQEQNTTGAG